MKPVAFADPINREAVFRILRWVFGVILLVFMLVPVLHCRPGHSVKDYGVWYDAGIAVLQGAEIYPDQWHKFPFMYPPPCALFLAAIAALGQTGLVVFLVLLNGAAWIGSILFSTWLATERRGRAHVLLYAIPNLIVLPYVWGNFFIGQPSLLLLALLLGAFISLRRRFNVLAGILIAVAAAIKAFPVLAIAYLIYRRHWIATVSLILTLAFLVLLAPIPFRGYAIAKQDLQRWSSGMLFKYDETGVGQRLGRSNSWKNQSIWGVSNRLLRHVEYDHRYEPHTPVFANFADLKFSTVNGIILAAALLLGVAFIGVMPAAAQRTPETDAIEFALLLLLMLIFTPLAFGYLFAWLLYPFTVVVQRLLAGRASRALLILAGVAVALLALSLPFQVPAQIYGNTFLATLLLFIGLALELWSLKRARFHTPGSAGC
ncbi:MAG: hypothetical protein QOD12_1736 [Verrucomicrobiota bacterium]|jgi:hypothetical protein